MRTYGFFEYQLIRIGISKTILSQRLGITLRTLYNKFGGRALFTLPEAIAIKNIVAHDMSFEERRAFKDMMTLIDV